MHSAKTASVIKVQVKIANSKLALKKKRRSLMLCESIEASRLSLGSLVSGSVCVGAGTVGH